MSIIYMCVCVCVCVYQKNDFRYIWHVENKQI